MKDWSSLFFTAALWVGFYFAIINPQQFVTNIFTVTITLLGIVVFLISAAVHLFLFTVDSEEAEEIARKSADSLSASFSMIRISSFLSNVVLGISLIGMGWILSGTLWTVAVITQRLLLLRMKNIINGVTWGVLRGKQ